MLIFEIILVFVMLLVGAASALLVWLAFQKNRDAEQKYHQAREAHNSAEDAHLRATHKLDQAHEELRVAEILRLQSQDDTDAMAQALKQAESDRDSALEQLRLANERFFRAEKLQEQAEAERDAANERALLAVEEKMRTEAERDGAIQARKIAEENARRAIQGKFVAEEQLRLANERVQSAEALKRIAEESLAQAEHARDEAIQAKVVAEEDAHRANERAEENLRRETQNKVAAEERIKRLEKALDAASKRIEQLENERDIPKPAPVAIEEKPQSRFTGTKPVGSIVPLGTRPPKRGEPKFSRTRTPRSPKPEIACIQKQNTWVLRVELPQEWLDQYSDLKVSQNRKQLDGTEDYWQLNDARGDLVVSASEREIWKTDLGEREEHPLLFKLTGNREQGRRVRALTQGWYLLVVPEHWRHKGYESQYVSIKGYHAYCRLIDDRHGISFQTSDGKSHPITPHIAQFTLTGNNLNDADESRGPLFGNTLPRIRVENPNAWQQVATIIIGEEGREREEWQSVVFVPDTHSAEQDLPTEIAQWQASWFFIRFYDKYDQLIESTDFRLARGFSTIQVKQASPLPSENGHSATFVEFHHTADCVIKSLSDVKTATDSNITLAEIPQRHQFDKTDWKVAAQGYEPIDITILVERIWWEIGTKEEAPSEWIDKPLVLTRADFAANSDKALWIRLPKPRWTNEIRAGFRQETARKFSIKVIEQTVSIPLCDFEGSESRQRIGVSPFVLWSSDSDMTLAYIHIQVKCLECSALTASEKDIQDHVERQHLGNIFRPLGYDELRKRVPSLPTRIYKCSYCGFYVVSDDPRNPINAISNHIYNRKCPKIPQQGERPNLQFRVIDDPVEIRENVDKNLPDIRQCKFCDELINWDTQHQAMRHLVEKHKQKLYELQ